MMSSVMNRLGRAALGVFFAPVFLSACASDSFLVSKKSVTIATTPPGATATSEHGDSCITPCKLRLPLSQGGKITISKEGYEDYETIVVSNLSKTRAALGETSDAVYYLDDPEPAYMVIDMLDRAINGDARYRNFDTRHITVALKRPGEAAPAESEDEGGDDQIVDENGVILLRR